MEALQIVFDNLNFNPDFQSQNRFSNNTIFNSYYKQQTMWMKMVGYDKRR